MSNLLSILPGLFNKNIIFKKKITLQRGLQLRYLGNRPLSGRGQTDGQQSSFRF